MPVQRTNDPGRTSDSVTKREVDYGSASGVQSLNKSISRATSSKAGNASLASPESGKQDVSSTYKSTRNASNDDTGTDIRPAQRTLPGYCINFLFSLQMWEEYLKTVKRWLL